MTNKQFLLQTLEGEEKTFLSVIEAVPADKADFKPHDRARTAESLVKQIMVQPAQMAMIIQTGLIDFANYKESDMAWDGIIAETKKNFETLKAALNAVSDEEWENGAAKLVYQGGTWDSKKYDMVWGFLFDLIHHRGQLSTYIRVMGGKVPAIYGGSADTMPQV